MMNPKNSILVVDDDPGLLAGTIRLLKKAGYTLLGEKTGQGAIQSALKNIPDLILLDNVLPDINGLEVCRRLKNNKTSSDIFICILSGSKTASSDQSNGLDIGADEYIARPISNRELLSRVKAMLRIRNTEKELKQHKNNLEILVRERTKELEIEILERKNLDEALSESKAFSKSVLNSLSAHIAVVDYQGKIIAVNEAWKNYARSNNCIDFASVIQGSNYFTSCKRAIDLYDDDHARQALNGILGVLSGSIPYFTQEYPCHSPNENRFFSMKVLPLEGEKSCVVVSHEDITELKLTEIALEKRTRELSLLNQISTQISQSLSMDQGISNALEGMLAATEASAVFLLLKKGDDLIPVGTSFSEPKQAFKEFPNHKIGECLCGMAALEGKSFYSSNINLDSRCTWEECKQAGLQSAAAIPLFKGEDVIAVMGLGLDAVHNFEAQAEYLETLASQVALWLQNALMYEQSLNNENILEIEVRNRTRKLEESQKALTESLMEVKKAKEKIEETNQRLQELDRLKSMFIASMSHELRTPLNSIIGFTGILLQGLAGELNEEQMDQLGRVSRAGNHLLALITDVIDVSKIEAGKVELFREVFLIDELINEARNLILPDAEAKGLTLEIQRVESIQLNTDRRRLLQCVMNLLSNAVKYSEKGNILVSIQKENENVKINVTDEGIGIAEDDQALLFNSFVRLESHLKTKIPGTGLGLYLTKKIVTELLGGKITAKSQLSQGSCFSIIIPLGIE